MPPIDSPLASDPATLERLVAQHRQFLAFVEKRVRDRALAEDILQDAFVKSLGAPLRDEDAAEGWFYRVLRNAIVDRMRRGQSQGRALEALARELADAPGEEERALYCNCVLALAATLKPEYAGALEAIDVQGLRVADYAERTGITANAASVRLHRARRALRSRVAEACGTCADHGCLDCQCEHAPERGAACCNPP
jgi:RNA polymerase sigma-70 factor (ECF subfamily)